jgi:hypothetical protein
MVQVSGRISVGRRDSKLPSAGSDGEYLLKFDEKTWELCIPRSTFGGSHELAQVVSTGPTYDLAAIRRKDQISIEIQIDGSTVAIDATSATYPVSGELPLYLSLFDDGVRLNMKKLFEIERQVVLPVDGGTQRDSTGQATNTPQLPLVRFGDAVALGHPDTLIISATLVGILGKGSEFAAPMTRTLLIFEPSGIRLLSNNLRNGIFEEWTAQYQSVHSIQVKEALKWREESSLDAKIREGIPSRSDDLRLRISSRSRGRTEHNFVIQIETFCATSLDSGQHVSRHSGHSSWGVDAWFWRKWWSIRWLWRVARSG